MSSLLYKIIKIGSFLKFYIILFYFIYFYNFCCPNLVENEPTINRKNDIKENIKEKNKENDVKVNITEKKNNEDINKQIHNEKENKKHIIESKNEIITDDDSKNILKNNDIKEINNTEINNTEILKDDKNKNIEDNNVEKKTDTINEYIKDDIKEDILENKNISEDKKENVFEDENIIKQQSEYEKIINNNLEEIINNLKYDSINDNLHIFKNIFFEIIKKCRIKAYFCCNNNIFSNFNELNDYKNKYVQFTDIYEILNKFVKNNKINCNYNSIKSYIEIDNNSNDYIEIITIKDPVYNFIYSIKCYVEKKEKNELERNKDLYLKNTNDKDIFLCDKKLYFYLNEKDEKKNKDELEIPRFIIFFKYILSLLDQQYTEIYCNTIDNKSDINFYVKNTIEMNVFSFYGTTEKNPIVFEKEIHIVDGENKK